MVKQNIPKSWQLKFVRSFLFLILLLIVCNSNLIASYKIPRLSPFRKTNIRKLHDHEKSSSPLDDFKTYYYEQTLDHFNYAPQSYATFKQKYVINSKYWGGAAANSPIFAYLGPEVPLDDYDLVDVGGFLVENFASRVKPLIIFIEHRYYGESIPFGSMEEAMTNKTIRGYFNSAQAIADYAEVLSHVKQKFSSPYSPIIVVGVSYGGMLAAWFRLKYPHVVLGALASSAPILYFDNITPQNGYYSIVTDVFKKTSMTCYQTIQKSWSEIDKVASRPDGLSILSHKFKTCSKLNSSFELKDFLDSLYASAAQYNSPETQPVSVVCGGIDEAQNKSDILGNIFGGVVASFGNNRCYDTHYFNSNETISGWDWLSCSEMVFPIGRGENDTMFPASPFKMVEYVENCKRLYGVPPRPHWITTYYGGHDIKLILHRFASNIIFSNGLRDPYSVGGVLEDISDSIVAVTTSKGSHGLDIHPSMKTDPEWLVKQRKIEADIIQGWLAKYYDDLQAILQN